MPSAPVLLRALQHSLTPAALLLLAPAVVGAQQFGERLQVHGFLTQGVAKSDSVPIYGIGPRATADYRAAALQVRFAATDKDVAMVQLAHRRMGDSPYNSLEPGVALQWAYYQRALPVGLRVKLGRAPMPRGIYNEVRKVGTVLPFYRAPYSFYLEGYEAVDGAILSRVTPVGAWELETSAYGGTVDVRYAGPQTVYEPTFAVVDGTPTMVGLQPAGDTLIRSNERAHRTVGGQLWVATPLRGLRVGAGAMRFDLASLSYLSGRDGRSAGSAVQGAVDGNFVRAQLRGEWEQIRVGEFLYTAHYVQGGVRVAERLSVNAQREQVNTRAAVRPNIVGVPPALAPRFRAHLRNALDHALGVNFAVRPNVLLKAEGHDMLGDPSQGTGTPTGRYLITSVALSF